MKTKIHNYQYLLLFALFTLGFNSCSKDDNYKNSEEEAAAKGDNFIKFKLNEKEVDYSDAIAASRKSNEIEYRTIVMNGVHKNGPSTASSTISISLGVLSDDKTEKIEIGTYTNPGIYKTFLNQEGMPTNEYPFILISLTAPSEPTVAHLALSATIIITDINDKGASGTFSANLSTGTNTKDVTDVITDGEFKVKWDK